MRGIVIKSTSNWYEVRCDTGEILSCLIKGNFRLKGIRSTNPVAVGDRVTVTPNPDGTAYITDIEERRNYIIRKSTNLSKQSHILAANIDLCLLLVTLNHPQTSTIFIDRFLASAEAYRIPVCLVFNKCDLLTPQEARRLDELMELYSSIGYTCRRLTALTGEGVEELRSLLNGKITLLAGNSGVGKSTLLNVLAPEAKVRTGEISECHDKGMHTTTFSEMFMVAPGDYVIDTPGVKGFGTFDMREEEIGHYFVEIFARSKDCKYGNCTHTHEPGCAVREAVEEGSISRSRYLSYLNMLEDGEEGKYREAF